MDRDKMIEELESDIRDLLSDWEMDFDTLDVTDTSEVYDELERIKGEMEAWLAKALVVLKA